MKWNVGELHKFWKFQLNWREREKSETPVDACYMSCVKCRVSHITCHMSYVTCDMSHVTYRLNTNVICLPDCLIYLSRINQAGMVCLIFLSRIDQAGRGTWIFLKGLARYVHHSMTTALKKMLPPIVK